MFTYGTVAEYSVGFVMLTFAWIKRLDRVVSRILREPTCGKKLDILPPERARSILSA